MQNLIELSMFCGTLKKNPAKGAVLTGYIDIPSVFWAQKLTVPGVAPAAIETTAPALGSFEH